MDHINCNTNDIIVITRLHENLFQHVYDEIALFCVISPNACYVHETFKTVSVAEKAYFLGVRFKYLYSHLVL